MARRAGRGEARRDDGLQVATAKTLTPADLADEGAPATVREAARGGAKATLGNGTLAFPDLGGAEDRRMEDLMAARLFPRRAAPQKIGRYTILDRLGQGGMGVVYAAYDPELDRKVAIKLLLETLADHAEARLRREAQAMARVAHANVVSVIDVGVHDGRAYVVMEYVRGTSLDRWQERAPHWRETLRVYVQAGRGLAAAHGAGVVHRDFKPHNVMLIEEGVDAGRVKVLDFGLARDAGREPHEPALAGEAPRTTALARPLTATGALMGTPAYMSPEQLAGAPATEQSDQFNFAASLYEALHGQLPYAGGTLSELLVAMTAGALRAPPAGSPAPAWLHRVVARGLARDPADRFPSMAAMCDALERDPSVRRRAVGLALALGAAVGGGGWGLAQLGADASPCTGPAFALTDVWNDARAAAVDAAFTATALPFAADTAARVRPILDAYADDWTTMRQGACTLHQRGEQSAQLLDLRMACLDRARAGFTALAGVLTAADATVVERAVEAALSLPDLGACADAEALTAATPPPTDPAAAHAVERARTRLAEIGAQLGAGRFASAAAAADAVLGETEAIGFAPAIAESALLLGTIHLEQGQGDAAERALTRATRQAIAGRADHVAAEALVRRLFVRGVLLAAPARAEDDDALADAYLARFPADGHLRWLGGINRGAVAYHRGDLAAARAFYEQALAVEHGATPLELARTRVNLGLLAFDANDFDTARAAYRAAIDAATATLGEQHPLVAQLGFYEGTALFELGRYRAARDRLTAGLAQMVAGGAEATPTGLWTRIYLARLAARLGDLEAARAHAARATALASDPLGTSYAELVLADATRDAPAEAAARFAAARERFVAAYGARSRMLLGALPWIGAGLLRAGLTDEAQAAAREWVELGRALEGDDAVTTARARRLLAETLRARGDTEAALTEARAALPTLTAKPDERPVEAALAHLTLGRAQLAAGAPAEAAATLRTGLELARSVDHDAPERADLEDALARALAAGAL